MDDEPLCKAVSNVTIDGRWLLTHALWKDHPETGVRDLQDVDEKTGRPRFDLIQHGCSGPRQERYTFRLQGLRNGLLLPKPLEDVLSYH